MKADYRQIAADILEAIGGKDNVDKAAHCVTRLRLSLKDQSKVDEAKVKEADLVKGAFENSGVYQVVIGAGDVERVYAEFIKLAGLEAATVAEVKSAGGKKMNPLQKLVKVFSDVFMPIIPAIIVAGLLMGINNLLASEGLFVKDATLIEAYPNLQGLWDLINMMANTSFVFLPALVGWSATKRFGGSEVLGIVMGLLLVHPDLLNAWGYGTAALEGDVPTFDILGLFEIEKVGYQGQILPVLAAAFILSHIEIFLKKHVPNAIQLLVVPITAIVVTGFLALAIVGPVTRGLGNVIAMSLVNVFEAIPVIGALLFGLFYAPLVVTGMHHLFIAIDLQLVAETGGTFIWPMIALSNIAQGSAALAMFFVYKHNAKQKSMASTSAISAYFGITEPAMFGVNLPNKFPFYSAMIGSATAAIFITLNNVQAIGIGVGGLPGFLSIFTDKILFFIVGMIIAIVVPFVLTFVLSKRYMKKGEIEQNKVA